MAIQPLQSTVLFKKCTGKENYKKVNETQRLEKEQRAHTRHFYSNAIASQFLSSSSSESSPMISGSAVAALTSLSFTYPNRLQAPTHINARVDWTDKRERRCDKRIRPLLKTRSTSTDVAAEAVTLVSSLRSPREEQLTRYQEVIQCHP
jgi:hypothetical protein